MICKDFELPSESIASKKIYAKEYNSGPIIIKELSL